MATTPRTPKIKHRAMVTMTDPQGNPYTGHYLGEQEFTDTYGRDVYLRIPVGKKIGKAEQFIVTVTYLGEKQYKQTYAQRVKAMASSDKRREKWQKQHTEREKQRQEKELVQRRDRIMNQIELAFVKQGKDAVNFVTCDECNALAAYLGLAYEDPGSQVIDPDQITGAWCETHHGQINKYNNTFYPGYGTKAAIACNLLEFFYDGLRQLYVKSTKEVSV